MRRNLGGTPDEIKSMSTEEVQGFFRSLHQKKPATGPLQWQTVKAELIHTVVTKQVSSTKEQLTGEWLPLSVWVSRGWDAETVLRQKNEWSESYGCQIFQVSVRADIWEECRVRVTESILRQERAANKKNKKEDLDVPVAESSGKQEISCGFCIDLNRSHGEKKVHCRKKTSEIGKSSNHTKNTLFRWSISKSHQKNIACT